MGGFLKKMYFDVNFTTLLSYVLIMMISREDLKVNDSIIIILLVLCLSMSMMNCFLISKRIFTMQKEELRKKIFSLVLFLFLNIGIIFLLVKGGVLLEASRFFNSI